MAFLLDCKIEDYEVRSVQNGVSKAGKPWASMKVEDMSGRCSAEISTSDPELLGSVNSLHKGDLIIANVRAVAGRERSYLVLTSKPQVVGNSYAPNEVDF